MANRKEVLEELEYLALIANRATARWARFARSIRALKQGVASGRLEPRAAQKRARELADELEAGAATQISDELGIDPDVRLN